MCGKLYCNVLVFTQAGTKVVTDAVQPTWKQAAESQRQNSSSRNASSSSTAPNIVDMRQTLLRLLALACLANLALSEETAQPHDGQDAAHVDQGAVPAQTSTPAADGKEAASASAAAAASPSTNYIPRQPNSRPRPRSGRRGNKGKNRCRVPGCSRCSATDRTVCETCRIGYGLTSDGQCQICGAGCQSCANTGPGKCDKCKKGFTLEKITSECKPCAPHCLQCDEAGPGGCNECGDRRMLHARLELHGEVHECLPCGQGCRRCSMEHGCEECDRFYVPEGNGVGCTFSWLKLLLLLVMVVALLGTCSYCLAMDDIEPRRAPPRRVNGRDRAEVLRRSSSHNEDDADIRRRGKSGGRRPEASPPREATSHHPGAYPLLQGYSGIEISDSYGAR